MIVANSSLSPALARRRVAAFPVRAARTERPRLRILAAAQATLPASLQKIVGAFQMVPDPMARYKQLLYFATKLEKLPDEDHSRDNKVEGCVSQVWVKPELRDDGKLYWSADSDSQLTKGLAALLVIGLSGCTPQEIIQLDPSFIAMLGLQQSLTPSRNNGFLNMFKLIQRKSLELALASMKGAEQTSQQATPSNEDGEPVKVNQQFSLANDSADGITPSNSATPIQDGIRMKLMQELEPIRLLIEDQSAAHSNHAARMTAPGKAGTGETHFKVSVISQKFEGVPLVKRQRMIYQLLQDEFNKGLHALSLSTQTPAEAEK